MDGRSCLRKERLPDGHRRAYRTPGARFVTTE